MILPIYIRRRRLHGRFIISLWISPVICAFMTRVCSRNHIFDVPEFPIHAEAPLQSLSKIYYSFSISWEKATGIFIQKTFVWPPIKRRDRPSSTFLHYLLRRWSRHNTLLALKRNLHIVFPFLWFAYPWILGWSKSQTRASPNEEPFYDFIYSISAFVLLTDGCGKILCFFVFLAVSHTNWQHT